MLKARLTALWQRISGSPIGFDLALYRLRVAEVAALEPALEALSQAQLEETARRCLDSLRATGDGDAAREGTPLLFAVVREGARRSLGMRLFDEQVIAGLALAEGHVVEMHPPWATSSPAVATFASAPPPPRRRLAEAPPPVGRLHPTPPRPPAHAGAASPAAGEPMVRADRCAVW